jgi:hypothetical protein
VCVCGIRVAGQIESAVLNRISVPLDGGTAKSSGITVSHSEMEQKIWNDFTGVIRGNGQRMDACIMMEYN